MSSNFHSYATAVYNRNLFIDNQGSTPMDSLETQELRHLTHAVKSKVRITVYELIVESEKIGTFSSMKEAQKEARVFKKAKMKCRIETRTKLVFQ